VNVAVHVHHTWVGDLVATLTHRGTTKTATLFERPGLPNRTPFGCPGEDIDVIIDDDATTAATTACAASIPAITGTRGPPPVGCPLYFNSDSARFPFSCRFRGGWNSTCGNNQLLAEFTSDGTQLTIRFPTVSGAPKFTAMVQSTIAAQLDHLTIGAAPPMPISGSVAIEEAGGELIVDPTTVPFSINGCPVERYAGSFDGFAGSAPAIDSARPLSVFDGDACDGTWELTVIDAAGANTGKLLGWSLLLAPQASPTLSPTAVATSTETASATRTATASRSPTAAGTISATGTTTATPSGRPTDTPSASRTPTPTLTLTAIPPTTPTPATPVGGTATATASGTITAAPPTSTQTESPTARPTRAACVGDCDGSGEVRINELIVGVGIALGTTPLDACSAFAPNGSGAVEINELVAAVNNALNGCAAPV
jgi:hypothetical protein